MLDEQSAASALVLHPAHACPRLGADGDEGTIERGKLGTSSRGRCGDRDRQRGLAAAVPRSKWGVAVFTRATTHRHHRGYTQSRGITAVDAAVPGFVTVYPCDTARPFASSLNFTPGAATFIGVIS